MVIPLQQIDQSPSNLGYIRGVQCVQCGSELTLGGLKTNAGTILESVCLDKFDGEYRPILDMDALNARLNSSVVGRDIARERYARSATYFGLFPELLPLAWTGDQPRIYVQDFPISPLVGSQNIGPELGVDLYFFDDGSVEPLTGLPTQSFKDRPVNSAVNIALEAGYSQMHVASTGNLVLSSVYIGGQAGLEVHAYLPTALSDGKKAKVAEIARMFGDRVKISYHAQGYDHINNVIVNDAIDLINKQAGRNIAISPNRATRTWYGMGEWTAAFEIVTQLYYRHDIERGRSINLYVPAGSGKLASMVTEAAKVLQDLNILQSPIRLWVVQPTLNNPIVQGYVEQVEPRLLSGETYDSIKIQGINSPIGSTPFLTIVESVAIAQPGSFAHTMESIANPNSSSSPWQNFRGGATSVDDSNTIDGLHDLVLREGRFPQFVGGMTFQGFQQIVNAHPEIRNDAHVVYLSGGGKGKIGPRLEELAAEHVGVSRSLGKGGPEIRRSNLDREKELRELAPLY
jgi:threonine synthase